MAELWIKNSMAVYRGRLPDNSEHAHFTVQLTFATGGKVWVETGGVGRFVDGVLIDSQVTAKFL